MNANSEPEGIAELTREYGAYTWERSGLGLVLGDFLLGFQVGLILGGQLGWALAQATRSGDVYAWTKFLESGRAMGHPLLVFLLLLSPLCWLVGKELFRRRYQTMGRVRLAEVESLRLRRIIFCVVMGLICFGFLCLMPMAMRQGWNSATALWAAGIFALCFPMACWRYVSPGGEALIGVVFYVFVLLALMGAKGTLLVGASLMVMPAALMGGLECMCQHLEFKALEKRFAKREQEEAIDV